MQINLGPKGAPSALLVAIIGSFIVYFLKDGLDPVFKTLAMVIVFWAIIKTWKKIDFSSQKSEIREIIDSSNSLSEIKDLEFRVGTGFGGMASSVLAIGAGAI